MADAAQLSSLADETPEGRSIVVLAKERYKLRGRELAGQEAVFVPFTAQTRMSGVNLDGREIRKGAVDAIVRYLNQHGTVIPKEVQSTVEAIARSGGTPLVVAENRRALGVIHLKDIVKGGMRERFDQLRQMGIKTVMITGDNPLTAAAIAREAGVDDFLAEATPRVPLPSKLVLLDRNRGELNFSDGQHTWRYRNRLRLEREFAIHSYHPTPYASAEFFYDTKYEKWSSTAIDAGCQFPIRRHSEIDAYYEHQNNTGKIPNQRVDALGLVLNLYF